MSEAWRTTHVRGWGPDYTNTDAVCSVGGCPWERTWEDGVPLGEIVDAVVEHMRREHPEA